MAGKSTVSSTLFVVLLLLAVTGEMTMVGVEGRQCYSPSHRFKGPCWSDTNCGNVCHNEGFPRGDCRGFRRRCHCLRPC